MIVYHGTILEISEPQILKSEKGRDFGFAFYTTDIQEQAIRWAVRRAKTENRKGNETYVPIVNKYEWNDVDSYSLLKTLEFHGPSTEWLDMVLKCRSDTTYSHNYDIVIGNIANDNVGETVSYVLRGIMRKEDAIEQLKFEKINNQIAFCTQKSLQYLNYIGSFQG